MTEPIDPPEGEVEGPLEPVPGGQPSEPPQPWMPLPGTYGSRNAGRRQSILEAFSEIVNQSQLGEVEDRVRNQGEVIDSYGDALATKVNADAVPTIAPLSQAINRRADPTFQLSDFMAPKMYGTDSRGDTVTVTPSVLSLGASTSGMVYFAFITPLINRAYEQLNFMVSAVSSTPRQMDVAVYVLDAETKALTRQVYEPNVGAGLPFTESVVTVNFPRWVAEQGSYVAIAWYQSGAGEDRYLLGLEEAARPLSSAVFPPKISAHSEVGTGGLDSVIDGSNATRVGFSGYWFTPYAELSEAISIILRHFQDPFTTDSGRNIARPWVGLTPAQIFIHPDGWAGPQNAIFYNSGSRAAIYESPMATDRVRIDATILPPLVGNNSAAIMVRCTNDMRSGLCVQFDTTGLSIRTFSNVSPETKIGASTHPVQASTAWSLAGSRTITIQYVDSTLTVYDEQGNPLLTWADTFTDESTKWRFTGIYFYRDSGGYPPRLDHWIAQDIPEATEE